MTTTLFLEGGFLFLWVFAICFFIFLEGLKELEDAVGKLQNLRRHFGLKSPLHFMCERTRTATEWEDLSGRKEILEKLFRRGFGHSKC